MKADRRLGNPIASKGRYKRQPSMKGWLLIPLGAVAVGAAWPALDPERRGAVTAAESNQAGQFSASLHTSLSPDHRSVWLKRQLSSVNSASSGDDNQCHARRRCCQ